MRTVLWGLLAFGVAGLVVGCVEWIKGRGRQLALASVPTVLLIASMLLGDSQSAARYTLLAVAVSFTGYNLSRWRRVIRWSSPMIAFAGTSILLIFVIELVPGIPKSGVVALLDVLLASTILFAASALWEVGHAFARPDKPLQPASGGKTEPK